MKNVIIITLSIAVIMMFRHIQTEKLDASRWKAPPSRTLKPLTETERQLRTIRAEQERTRNELQEQNILK